MEWEAVSEPKYYSWTYSGLNCLVLGSDCSRCELLIRYQRSKEYEGPKKCCQAESNARLLAAGITPPEKDKIINLMQLGREHAALQ